MQTCQKRRWNWQLTTPRNILFFFSLFSLAINTSIYIYIYIYIYIIYIYIYLKNTQTQQVYYRWTIEEYVKITHPSHFLPLWEKPCILSSSTGAILNLFTTTIGLHITHKTIPTSMNTLSRIRYIYKICDT